MIFMKQEFFPITEDDEDQNQPRIQDGRVVYMDYRFGSGSSTGSWEHAAIFLYDLNTKERIQITNGESIAATPDIFGNIVVWLDYRHCDNPQEKNDFQNIEIYGYNLKTKKEVRLTNIPDRPKANPRIWGEKLFVEMSTSYGSGLFVFDLPSELTGT